MQNRERNFSWAVSEVRSSICTNEWVLYAGNVREAVEFTAYSTSHLTASVLDATRN